MNVNLRTSLDYESNRTVRAISTGMFPRHLLPQLGIQLYLQECWPSHISFVYSNLDPTAVRDRDLVSYIVEVIRAESLGIGSGGISHAELAMKFAAISLATSPRR